MSPASISHSQDAPERVNQIGVASGINDDLGEHGVAAFLALEDRPLNGVILNDRRYSPGMKQKPDLGLVGDPDRQCLERLWIDSRGPSDNTVISRGTLRPIGGGRRVPAAPVGAWRPGNRVLRQPIDKLLGEAADNLPAGPIGHAIDPDDEAAGGKPAEVIVALDQQHVGPEPRRRNGGSSSGRAATDHQHIGFDADHGAKAAAAIAAPWGLAENLALSDQTSGRRRAFFFRHAIALNRRVFAGAEDTR